MSVLDIEIKRKKESNEAALELFFRAFGPKAEQALYRSLKRAATSVKVRTGQEARKHYNVTATAVKKAAAVTLSKADHDAMTIFKSARLPLYSFGPSPKQPRVKQSTAALTVKVKATRKPVRTAFVARMKNGHVGVYQRTGEPGRNKIPTLEKIKELTSVSIPQMVGNPEIREWVQKHAVESFDKNFTHEMEWVMKQGLK